MKKVEKGLFVKVNYTGTLENGEVFDTNLDSHPFEVEVGAGKVIRGFEDALLGMAQKEKKTFTLPPEEAYGHRKDDLEQSFNRSELPKGFDPQVGQVLVLSNPSGGQIPATVTRADAEGITVDLNHPMAGKSLTFEIEILEINDVSSPCQCSSPSCGCGRG